MITFENVGKLYARGAKPALVGASIKIERGDFVFLVGASGSGKSTMLSIISGEERPTSGTVYVLGKDVSRISDRRMPYLRREIGNVFQDFRLLAEKNVFENVALAMQVIGRPGHLIRRDVPRVLDLVGLRGMEHRRMYELSGGEKQRVAIARAMVNRPKLLLADEPTGNLDYDTAIGIMGLLDRINREGTTVIMATHDRAIVNQLRKRVVELIDGKIVRDQEVGEYGGSR